MDKFTLHEAEYHFSQVHQTMKCVQLQNNFDQIVITSNHVLLHKMYLSTFSVTQKNNVTDGQTTCHNKTALCIASRGNKFFLHKLW